MKIVLYKDKKGEYRWKLVARNGRIVADCAEGYKTKAKMVKTVEKVLQWADDYIWGFDNGMIVDKTSK